jgi:hypothetical protein
MPTECNLKELVPRGHPWGYGAAHGSRSPDTEARLRTIPGAFPDELTAGTAVHSPAMSTLDASLPLPLPATGDEAALRDAEKIADRIAQDEAAAREARLTYHARGLPEIQADGAGVFLQPGEVLHAVYGSAILEDAGWTDRAHPRGGTLYLTSERLVHTGVESSELSLAAIDEMGIGLERLVLIRLRDGSDMAIEVDQPRLLRVQLAAAIAALRARDATRS